MRVLTALALLCMLGAACGGGGGGSEAQASPHRGCSVSVGDAYARAVLADNPIAYYRLSEASGSKMCDASPKANDGTYAAQGVQVGGSGAIRGGADHSILADGTAKPGTSSLNLALPGGDFTLEAWFKTTAKRDQIVLAIGLAGQGRIAGIGPASAPGTNLCGGVGDAVGFDTYDGYFTASSSSIEVFDGGWHYMVGAYDAAAQMVSIYLDGKLLRTAKVADAPVPSPVRVGYWVDSVCNSPFSGSIDEVAVYPTALPAARVAAHYATATG